MTDYQLDWPPRGYTDQAGTLPSLNEMLATLEAYRAGHGPFLRELRCQRAVPEHLETVLSDGARPPYASTSITGIPLVDDVTIPAGLLRFVYDDGSTAEHRVLAPTASQMALPDWANSLLPPEIAAAGLHFEWVETGGVPDFLPAGQRATLAAANRHANERIAEWRERAAQLDGAHTSAPLTAAETWEGYTAPLYWGQPVTDADRNTPSPDAMVCAHICGPDPDHRCDARAVTFLEHANLAGGVTRMPVCRPCNTSERAMTEAGNA